MGEGPLGHWVRQGACQVKGGEGVQAFYAPAEATNASYPSAVAGEVLGVYLVNRLWADFFLGSADAACGFDAGDRCPE